jgi:ABC-2 type transport system ATP-binding protein
MVEYSIYIEHLTKKFRSFTAVENLCLKIKKGTICGLIGPNGSGKTTTIQCLLGIYSFEKGGKILILDKNIETDMKQIYPHIGYMPQEIALYPDLSIEQNLQFFGRLKLMPKTNLKERIEELLDIVQLKEFRKREISKCSGGMQRRASLACALLSDPQILILDEPTVGVDPELRIEFWNYFRKLATTKGVTTLVTTHYLGEAVYCDEIAFLRKSLIVKGTLEEIKALARKEMNTIEDLDMDRVFIHFSKKKEMEVDM